MEASGDKAGQLGARYAIPSRLGFSEGRGGFVEAWLRSGGAEARVSLLGATVLSWRPAGRGEVLYLSGTSRFEAGRLIRGGIPLCLPWFGAHPADPGLPRHGFFRLVEWTVAGASSDPGGVDLLLSLASSPGSGRWWPCRFEASCRIRLGEGLDIGLSVRNTGAGPWSATWAFHPYFRFPDVRQAALPGLEHAGHEDLATIAEDGRGRPGRGAPSFSGEVDRAYAWAGPAQLVDSASGSRVTVDARGADSLVVWTPWREGCRALPDVGQGDYDKFLCVEPALMRPRAVEPEGVLEAGLGLSAD